MLNQANPSDIVHLRGGGFESMSRLAKSNAPLWRDIFQSNRKNLKISLKEYQKELDIFVDLLDREDWENMQEWIYKANKLQDILLN